jgi:glycosyltransferase involved in cell wall biosynthesis
MTASHPRHILIFEPDPRGHTQEWLEHLLRFACEERSDWRFTLAISPELADRLSQALTAQQKTRVIFAPLTACESRLCLHGTLAISGFARWWTMRRYLKKSRAEHGLFLCMDHLSLPLALGLRMGGPSLSGILFRPSTHYGSLNPKINGALKERIRDLRKRILYALMLRNPALAKVFSLDPYFVWVAAKTFVRGDKIEALGDPAFPLPEADENVRGKEVAKTRFLLFGSLTERKGILTLLQAVCEISSDTACKVEVIMAGMVEPAIRPAIETSMTAARRAQPALSLTLDDRRLTTDELAALVRRSDVILAPYQRFVGSSGVMLWAASAGKPIITQDYGLLGKLCRDYELGLAIDACDPGLLAAAIESMANDDRRDFNISGMKRLVAERTPHRFAATLFDGMMERKSPLSSVNPKPTQGSHTGHVSPLR